MASLFDLSGKVALVTGGAGLLGRALSEGLAEHDASVVIGDTAVQAGSALASDLGSDAEFRELDITSEKSIKRTIQDVHETYDGIDVLVNSAYPRTDTYGQRYEEVTFDNWRQNLDMHLDGYFFTSYTVSKLMMTDGNGGSIINIGSTYGTQAPDFSIYEGTDMTSPVEYAGIKGGVINLTRYLASYLGKFGIRANALSPGGIFNDQAQRFVEEYKRRTPLGRMAEPEDFKGPIIFLASDASRYVTGHNLLVDGGWTIC
ncbi:MULTISPECIES: oxidoreductase [Salinibaculum]|uniref:oxidoreductase n=1 Tax=Salinibaculum TaxID=2732368 RepID=UPI0030CDC028